MLQTRGQHSLESQEAHVLSFNQLTLLHRHGDDWRPLESVGGDHSIEDHDLERRLLRGEKLYRCTECELEILAVPPDAP